MKNVHIIVLCFILISCKDEEKANDEMVKLKLEERRQNFIAEKTDQCTKELMMKIEELADSILIYQSKRTKYDSLTIPYDSIRPEKPEVIFPDYKKPEKPEEKLNVEKKVKQDTQQNGKIKLK